MPVRAKFQVDKVEKQENGSANIHLSAVVDGSPENKDFFKWTPGGNIKLPCLNEKATEQFSEGDEFYVDFTKADAE